MPSHGEGHFIADWVEMLDEARDAVRARHRRARRRRRSWRWSWRRCKVSLANLRTFPWIAERERDGALTLHGAHFSIAEGALYMLDEAEDAFRPV